MTLSSNFENVWISSTISLKEFPWVWLITVRHLHSPLNTWLQYFAQRQLQARTRNNLLSGFSTAYIRDFTLYGLVKSLAPSEKTSHYLNYIDINIISYVLKSHCNIMNSITFQTQWVNRCGLIVVSISIIRDDFHIIFTDELNPTGTEVVNVFLVLGVSPKYESDGLLSEIYINIFDPVTPKL